MCTESIALIGYWTLNKYYHEYCIINHVYSGLAIIIKFVKPLYMYTLKGQ